MSDDGLFDMVARSPLRPGERVIVSLVHADVEAVIVRTGVANGSAYVRLLWEGEEFNVSPGHVTRATDVRPS